MPLKPIGRNVLIKADKLPEEKVSEGGIVLPGSRNERPETFAKGVVVDVGEGGFGSPAWGGELDVADDKFGRPDPTLIGKRVLYKNLQAHTILHDNESFEIVDMDGIVAFEPEAVGG